MGKFYIEEFPKCKQREISEDEKKNGKKRKIKIYGYDYQYQIIDNHETYNEHTYIYTILLFGDNNGIDIFINNMRKFIKDLSPFILYPKIELINTNFGILTRTGEWLVEIGKRESLTISNINVAHIKDRTIIKAKYGNSIFNSLIDNKKWNAGFTRLSEYMDYDCEFILE